MLLFTSGGLDLTILVVRQIDVFSCLLLTCFAVFCTFCFTFRLCCIILSFCFTRKMAFVRLNKPYDDLKNLVFITAADSLSVVSNTVIMAGVGCCGVWWNWRSDNNAALECFKVLCEHGGECVNTATDYTCTCQPGFLGDRCENGKQTVYSHQGLMTMLSKTNYLLIRHYYYSLLRRKAAQKSQQ